MNNFSRFPAGIKNLYSTAEISLFEIYELIKHDTWLKDLTTLLRGLTSKEKQNAFKCTELEYVTFGGVFSERRDGGLLNESGLICIDIDEIENPGQLKRSILQKSELLLLAFISPRGNGLKLVFRCNPAHTFKENYQIYSNYLVENFPIHRKSIDQSCSSISKACFLCHDPEVYFNPALNDTTNGLGIDFLHEEKHERQQCEIENRVEINAFELSNFLFTPIKLNFEKRNSIENFVALCRVCIKNNGDFVEGNRHNWVLKLALICNAFGMAKDSAIKHFQELYKNHPSITSSKHPFDVNNDLVKPFLDVYEKYLAEFGTWNDDIEVFLTPHLPDEIFSKLPHFFKKLTGLFPDRRERDVFFLGLLTMVSTCVPLLQGVYDKKRVRANLFTFISAPAASGKGVLSWVKKLGEDIHEDFLNEFNREWAAYQSLDEEERRQHPKPELKRLFIAADNTSANIISNLGNNQYFGIIYDNEADTLSKANKSEHGHFSNLLRKGFHHESIHYERKTNSQSIFIKEPAFSILLSGTPGQIDRMADDVENGLTSRFIFYNYVSPVQWKDVFADGEDLHGIFKSSAVELSQLTKGFLFDFIGDPQRELLFELTSDQKEKLNSWFEEKVKSLDSIYGTDIRGPVFRLGLILFRIAMVLSSIRHAENNLEKAAPGQQKISCIDADFNTAIMTVQTLLHHTVDVYNKLKKRGIAKRDKNIKERFNEKLPSKFNRAKAMEIASLMQIKEKTAEHYLSLLTKDGKLIKPQHNQYEKSAV